MQSLCLFSLKRTRRIKEGGGGGLPAVSDCQKDTRLYLNITSIFRERLIMGQAEREDAVRLCIMLFNMFKADETVSCSPCVLMLVLTG